MASEAIIEVTDSNFDQDVLKSEQPVLVDFWATWCGPCKAIAPIVDELAKEYHGKVKVGKMNTDENMDTPGSLKISAMPTVLVFHQGREVDRLLGVLAGSGTATIRGVRCRGGHEWRFARAPARRG